MDVILNDGTHAFNVTPWELEQLRHRGLVGHAYTTNAVHQSELQTSNAVQDMYEYALDNLHKCWKCGCTIDASNTMPTIPPMHECKKCRDAWARKVAEEA